MTRFLNMPRVVKDKNTEDLNLNILVLTQTGGILRPFAVVLGYIMDFIYRFLEMIGISNIGLTIVLFTLVVNILMIPLTIRQQKFTKMSAIMNPELQKINKKYETKNDEHSLRMRQAETQAVYDKYGASPVGGCLPLLIQMPILFALYRVIYNVPAYVQPVKEVYEKIASPIMSADSDGSIMSGLIESLALNVKDFDITSLDKVVDALYVVKSNSWDVVSEAFSKSSEVVNAIATYSPEIIKMNSLPLGLNIADAPVSFSNGISGIFPGIIIPILSGLTQWISLRLNSKSQGTELDPDNPMSASMKSMNVTMPLVSMFFTMTLPAGMGIYWIASAVFRTATTLLVNKHFANIDVEQVVEANKEKAKKKAEKLGEKVEKLDEYANMKTSRKSVTKYANTSVKRDDVEDIKKASSTDNTNKDTNKASKKAASGKKSDGENIASIANMLKDKKR